jgi:TM2 domain-containing membrane protein YozV
MTQSACYNRRGSAGNVIAAICNFLFPGLGHLVQGRILGALFFFVAVSLGYFFWVLIFPLIAAIILHLWCIISAATYNPN